MALDSYASIWNKVLLRCPSAGPLLAQDWVSHSFRRLAERRLWSWLIKYGQFVTMAAYNTGQVTCTLGSPNVVGVGTNWVTSMTDAQFRIGTQAPIYTVITVTDGQNLILNAPWGYPTQTLANYEIYNAYVSVPTDFLSLFPFSIPGITGSSISTIPLSKLIEWTPSVQIEGTPMPLSHGTITLPLIKLSLSPVMSCGPTKGHSMSTPTSTYQGPLI